MVNNAASMTAAPTLEQDVEPFDMMFDVDVRAPFFLTGRCAKDDRRGSSAIVNISSMGASVGVPFAPVAAATKAALESFNRSWAAAFDANGIRVNTVAPGATRTDGAVGTLRRRVGAQLGSNPSANVPTAPSVRVAPGATVLTRIPLAPNAAAQDRVKEPSAALAAAVTRARGRRPSAHGGELTMAPDPRAIIFGSSAAVRKNGARTRRRTKSKTRRPAPTWEQP